ncbi:MAG: hypothetical protein DI584_01480 [Stenotrophomonas sp.]|nr:MAG: hypothetical protein DI584_01480 [Stenotrophomonas sp.]
MIETIFVVLAGTHRELSGNLVAIAIALTLVFACFFVAFGLQIYAKAHWFAAWLLRALLLPGIILASELVRPTGWLGVALVVGGLASITAASLGVAAGWGILRRESRDRAARR